MPQTVQRDYPITPLPFTAVTIDDGFWAPRLETNRRVTIPYDLQKCRETGRIANFRRAAGQEEGDHMGLFFNDSDVFKVVEGAAYSLATHPDAALDAQLDTIIATIGAAQEADGYLYTARTIRERRGEAERLDPLQEGRTRWSNLRINHELYNAGHLYEAAAAHYAATGKRTLLDIALRNAELIAATFGLDGRRDVPGHQEIELGLVKLYRLTGEARYLTLAKFFLDERGHYHGRPSYDNYDNPGYMQDHLPVTEQAEAVGHAVRALYMYAAMADVAALTDDRAYGAALDRLWRSVIERKLYLTGGVGARHHGEAFGEDYELPNLTAYAETCAAIANIFWQQRMFLLHGDARYIDVLERTLYNGFLSGIGRTGATFFYANPLASDGAFLFNSGRAATRLPWFDCSCCPTNVVRLLASLGGYIYATRGASLYVNLFVGGTGVLRLDDGRGSGLAVRLIQQSDYPWQGRLALEVQPERPARFSLHLRVPGWARGRPVPGGLYRYEAAQEMEIVLRVNGEPAGYRQEQGYAVVTRHWSAGDRVELELPMPVRLVETHAGVAENVGAVALERGPLVYCVEGWDHGGTLARVRAPAMAAEVTADLGVEWDEVGERLTVLTWGSPGGHATAIPYYAWSRRGPGVMRLWLPRRATAG